MPATQFAVTEKQKDASTPVIKAHTKPTQARHVTITATSHKDSSTTIKKQYSGSECSRKSLKLSEICSLTFQSAQFNEELMRRCKEKGLSDGEIQKWMEET